MKNPPLFCFLLCVVLILSGVSVSGYSDPVVPSTNTFETEQNTSAESTVVICHKYSGVQSYQKQQYTVPVSSAQKILDMIEILQEKIARDPGSDQIPVLQDEILVYAQSLGLVADDFSFERVSDLVKLSSSLTQRTGRVYISDNRASGLLCNYASTGSGSALPVIIFPRLIPVLLTPIPRVFYRWQAVEGVTSCGELFSGTGFIAKGQQTGSALGFWGIGFSVFLPPVMAYGIIGYALLVSVQAEEIELWPPNSPPVATALSPLDGAIDVPTSTSELRFSITDFDNDLMSYQVTTDPDVGAGSASNVTSGEYTIPLQELEGSEQYRWFIQVSDGEDVSEAEYSFSTELTAPVVSDIYPSDGSRHIQLNLSHIRFILTDYQNDPMNYTVETAPDIGSDQGSQVENGEYSVNVGGLDYETEYSIYINVTDGENWKHKKYCFETILSPGPWWNTSWSYRKYLGIENTASEAQLKLTVYKQDGYETVNGSVIDCENHCNKNFTDIRFITFSGSECSYWIEQLTTSESSVYATIWVKLPSTADEAIYLYYGNPAAQDLSDGDATFLLFDDFEQNNLEKWWDVDEVWTTQSSIVKSGNYAAYGYDNSTTYGGSLIDKHNYTSFVLEEWVRFGENNRYHYPLIPTGYSSGSCNGIACYLVSAKDDGHWGYYTGDWPYKNFPNDKTYTADTWYHVKLSVDIPQQRYWVEVDNECLTNSEGLPIRCGNGAMLPADGTLRPRVLVGGGKQKGSDFWLDTFILRKFCEIPPIWVAFGSEESLG